MKFHFAIGLLTSLLLSISGAHGAMEIDQYPDVLIYSRQNSDQGWKVAWQSVPDSEISGAVAISFAPGAFSAPEQGHFFAITDSTSNHNDIFVVDLLTSSLVKLDVPLLHKEGFDYDSDYIASRSMRWSPDGTRLAFIGRTGNERADLYLYDPAADSLNNLSTEIDFTSDILNFSDWSPDGQWLALTGQWQANHSWLMGGILSKDGNTFIKLDSSQPICRLFWSPDQQHLLSPTDCTTFPTNQRPSEVIIFPVDLADADAAHPAPFHLGGDRQNNWHYYHPTWLSENTIIALQIPVQPMLNGTPIGTPAPPPELIRYNINTLDTQALPADKPTSDIFRYGTPFKAWIYWMDRKTDSNVLYALNPGTETLISIPHIPGDACPERYFRLSPNQSSLAYLSGCNQVVSSFAIVVANVADGQERFQIQAGDQTITPLGWVELVSPNGS